MAGRNHNTPAAGLKHRHNNHRPRNDGVVHPHRRLTATEVRLIEDRIAAQSREIETLLLDNQRLATSYVALKQDLVAAEQELRHISATAASVKAERDAQVREVYERSLRLEDEARSVDGISAELERVRADINALRSERKELLEKLKDIDGDVVTARAELQQLPDLKSEIEAAQIEIQRGRAAIEHERKMSSNNFEQSEAMEKLMISLAREAEKLRSELANAEQRAMAAAAAAASAANPGAVYATHQINYDPGYGGNPLYNPHAVNQVTFDAGANYGLGAGIPGPPPPPPLPPPPPPPPGTYDMQGPQVHS
ncbi:hypothetical protein ABFS82_04G084300 [Erythranthe guttata]|uniref:Protein FLC EXPRESSOR n=1 Tax=Erythranthe guttata TaxID=4155 RepID=A0A022RZP1_ERYGU|nr:PREDICTED: protein FLC EXPRESSOR [Erythranthe guttata]EYU45982.1 hypothetical protein MIMGU_mgv1a010545mg [Erythranthe guttata]|eukprot:XP_012838205.1 PREDICTED: protein FLC EXPRESSOR [Erythranthe guttata]